MEDLKNKNKTIVGIYKHICEVFGRDFFELTDIWESDCYALGLKKQGKLIYISTWDHRHRSLSDMCYYVEFELIDDTTNESKAISKQINNLSKELLIIEMNIFLNEMP